LGLLSLFPPRWFHHVTGWLGVFALAAGITLTTPLVMPETFQAQAQTAKKATAKKRAPVKRRVVRAPASPTDPKKDAALIIDGATGRVLFARNAEALRHPASLTKMMTLYMLFEALKAGKVNMQTPLPVSAHATRQKPTKLNLRKGDTIGVDSAIRALVIRSANDVASVVAEALGGTEGNFALQMTAKARALGMMDTNFHNASGLPNPLQITSAKDMAMLGRRLAYDFPQYYHYFALAGFTWKGTWYTSHNNLIGRYDGADGMKTGYTNASGFNLVTSVVRQNNHLIAVVLGGRTALRRDLEMMRLLDQTFTQIAASPNLVASRAVPWHSYGNTGPVVTAGLGVAPELPPAHTLPASLAAVEKPKNPFASLLAMNSPAMSRFEDEDSAEKRVASDEDRSIMGPAAVRPPAVPAVTAGLPAMPAPNAVRPLDAARNARPVPAIRPSPRPAFEGQSQVQMARNIPPPPMPRPSVAADLPEGDTDEAPTPGRNWTIQIGAYADQSFARAQLAAYADKARDVLGQAARIVTPASGNDGKTIYRARFGLFGEAQARDVCSRLTSRGQTCFAALASAR
jgi:D-alanyl-D-alanine carboxypeptidase